MEELKKLVRSVILSSIAATVGHSASANTESIKKGEEEGVVKKDFILENKYPAPKLLLKMASDNSWDIKSHRSHRSHSSHRSHYSSSPGSSSSRSRPSGTSPSPSSTSPSSLGIKSATPSSDYKLGTRTLKRGDTGSDVTELVNILLKKKYLIKEGGNTPVVGVLTFDEVLEDAVKEFQKDNNQKSDGIVGPATVYLLKKNDN